MIRIFRYWHLSEAHLGVLAMARLWHIIFYKPRFIAGHYDARLRMLIKHVAWQLRVTWEQVEEIESDLAVSLEYNTYVMSE